MCVLFLYLLENSESDDNEQINNVSAHVRNIILYHYLTASQQKQILSFGIESVTHKTYHTLRMCKIFGVATSVFLPKDKGIERGERALKLQLVRVEQMVRANELSFKLVYASNGSYNFPNIPNNRIRMEGNFYFRKMKINVSKEG